MLIAFPLKGLSDITQGVTGLSVSFTSINKGQTFALLRVTANLPQI